MKVAEGKIIVMYEDICHVIVDLFRYHLRLVKMK